MLRLDHYWIWDSWVADDGAQYHLYFLQAPRSLEDMALRHVHATVGHATSRDLVTWDYRGQCLGPAETGFDDLAIWTGSVLQAAGHWWMCYTAISTAGHHIFDQRIGAAVSDDLHHWRRVSDQSTLPVDRRWYKTLHVDPPATTGPDLTLVSQTWRDPLVLPDLGGMDGTCCSPRAPTAPTVTTTGSSRTLSAVTSRPGTSGRRDANQARALANSRCRRARSSAGAQSWSSPVTQRKTKEQVARWGEYCTWSVPSPGVVGPWDISKARPFTAGPNLFAAPLVQLRDGSWAIIGFRNLEPQGIDGFCIIDPIPVTLDAEGYLVAT